MYDLVGYDPVEGFIILNAAKNRMYELPDTSLGDSVPICIRCTIENNQNITFGKTTYATLHDVRGTWHYKLEKPDSALVPLPPFTFFEIGHAE